MRIFALLLTLITGFGLTSAATAAERLNVLTSFSILGDMVENIGGDHVKVTSLIQPDSDAHSYTPRPKDIGTLSKADLVIFNGLQFEGWMQRLLDAAHYTKPVVIASTGITPLPSQHHHDEDGHEHHEGHEHHHGKFDPHAWLSLSNGAQYARNIRDGLIKADPAHADEYRTRADQYIGKMEHLDGEVRNTLQSLPKDSVVVTSHAAFGYLANAYGLTFLAPIGQSTEAEASAGNMVALIDRLRQKTPHALFVENMSSPALINQLSQETGVPVSGVLYSDALTRQGDGSSYLGMMTYNMQQLVKALSPHK